MYICTCTYTHTYKQTNIYSLHFAAVQSAHQSNVMEHLKQAHIPSLLWDSNILGRVRQDVSLEPLPAPLGTCKCRVACQTCSAHALCSANASHQRCKKGRGPWHEPKRWRHGASSRQFALNCCHLFRLALSTKPSCIIILSHFFFFFYESYKLWKLLWDKLLAFETGAGGQRCGYLDCYIKMYITDWDRAVKRQLAKWELCLKAFIY